MDSTILPDLAGFRTDPTRRDTDRDGVNDNFDWDPLHDLMIRLTIGEYEALDDDPDFDKCFLLVCVPDPTPEPFIEVEYRGESFYTPYQDPEAMSVSFDDVYTLDIPDYDSVVTVTLRAWDNDLALAADKQWDLDNSSGELDAVVSFNVLDESTGDQMVTGLNADGDEGSCGTIIPGPDPNACRDASLSYRIDTVRLGRINTILVDSLDVDDLLETPSGDLRYLGDGVFYVGWIDVTYDSGPFTQGLNAILVPRVQFFNSSVNHTLQTAGSAEDLPAYLKGLTFTAFNESAEETTTAIAGVLNGTLSGTAANLLLQDLIRGPDAVVNGNWTVVTEQVVTLGLPDRVVNAIPLEGIRFDEAVGEGPGDLFSDFLDFLLDAAAFVVQGLVLIGTAIANFFVQAVTFLVELGMAVIGAIAEFLGQVVEAVESVGKVLGETLSWLTSFLIDFVTSAFSAIIDSLAALVNDFVQTVADVVLLAVADYESSGTISDGVLKSIDEILLGELFIILLATAAILMILLTLLAPFTFSFGFIAGFAAAAIITLFLQSLFGQAAPEERAGPSLDPSMSISTIVDTVRSFVASLSPSSLSPPSYSATQDSDSILCSSLWAGLGLALGSLSAFLAAVGVGLADPSGFVSAGLAWTFALFALLLAAGALGLSLVGGSAATAAAGATAAAISGVSIVLGVVALKGASPPAKIAGGLTLIVAMAAMFISAFPVRECL